MTPNAIGPDEFEVDGEQVLEDRASKQWIKLITHAVEHFRRYQEACDKADKELGQLEQLASNADSGLEIYWANLEVLKPSVYAREPVPLVIEAFKSEDPVADKAAELLERSLVTQNRKDKLHRTFLNLRDDLLSAGRAVPWNRLEMDRDGKPRIRTEHVDRADFIHAPAREWYEVPWVARRSYLDKKSMAERFQESSGGAWTQAEFKKRDIGPSSGEGPTDKDTAADQAEIWELWHRTENVVVWVCEQCDVVLDASRPLYDLEDFFPCPEPAYSNVERRTLLPIPDYYYYAHQIEEINKITKRIAALTASLRAKGIYNGAADEAEALEKLLKIEDDRALLVPAAAMSGLLCRRRVKARRVVPRPRHRHGHRSTH